MWVPPLGMDAGKESIAMCWDAMQKASSNRNKETQQTGNLLRRPKWELQICDKLKQARKTDTKRYSGQPLGMLNSASSIVFHRQISMDVCSWNIGLASRESNPSDKRRTNCFAGRGRQSAGYNLRATRKGHLGNRDPVAGLCRWDRASL